MISFNNYSIFSIIADFQNYENLDIFLIYLMLIAAIIPIISISKHTNLPDRLAAASSFGSKLSLIIIFYSFLISDWMIGSIGAFTLIVGDTGLILLSLLYKEDYT